jgi:hypothetical protein
VFHPTAGAGGDTNCGRDDNGSVVYPEAYSNQVLYGGVTPSCAYTYCEAGQPTYGNIPLTLTVGSSPVQVTANLYCDTMKASMGTGSYTGYFSATQSVTITAPATVDYQAQWTGYCSFNGSPGVASSCTIPMAVAETVGVSMVFNSGCPNHEIHC